MRRARVAGMVIVVAGLIGFMPGLGSAAEKIHQKNGAVAMRKLNLEPGGVADEPRYQGKTLSYWLKVIRDRDEEIISIAFDAIRSMGPQASSAVPELTRIVAAPFIPIQIGRDSDDAIADKLYDIEVRSEAIDALASIGKAASPATAAVIQWGLTLRVISEYRATLEEEERFIDLVTLDAEYRLRVIAAVGEFGNAALPTLIRLLKSSDTEKRQIAVAILGMDALELAAKLMKSGTCEDKQLAIAILSDMEPVVAKAYLAELRRGLTCEAD